MDFRMESVSIVKKIPVYSLTSGLDACKWGVSDLYEEAEKNLRELLTYSGEFRTEWCSCKKEEYAFRLWFHDDYIHVAVSNCMDDLYDGYDLIDDALWDLGKQDVELSDDDVDRIRELCMFSDVDTEVTDDENIKRDSTYEEIMETLERLADETDKWLEDYYETVKNIISYYLENEREERKDVEE